MKNSFLTFESQEKDAAKFLMKTNVQLLWYYNLRSDDD